MAHNLAVLNGKAMYTGRQAAWHTLGNVTGTYQTWAQIEAQGFDFSVFKSQLHDGLGRLVDAWGMFRWDAADKAAGLKDKAVFLGAVGADYKDIHHSKGFRLVDALVASRDNAHYETAGVLGKGEIVWGLADLDLACNVGADKQVGYLLFSTSHNGRMSFNFRLVMRRVVCENTLDGAMSEKTRASLTIRHTKNADLRIGEAHDVLQNLGSDVSRMEDKLNFLAGKKLNREAMVSIMDRLFPKRTVSEDGKDVNQTRRENILADVLKVYELNDGNAFPEQRGSAYNLLNAVTAYTDHVRSSKVDGRAESALFGSGDKLKSTALEVITLAARDMDSMPAPRMYMGTAPSSTASYQDAPAAGLLDQIIGGVA